VARGSSRDPAVERERIARSLRAARERLARTGDRARDTVAMAKRSYGTGQLMVKRDAQGRESWYGRWRVGRRRVNRKLGLKRVAGSREGLTRSQAERQLQRVIDVELHAAADVRMTVGDAGELLVDHLESLGRKRSTVGEYRSYVRVHLAPFFGETELDRVTPARIEAFIAAKRRAGLSTKSILNYLGLLHSIFDFAQRRGFAAANPCKQVDKPERPCATPDVRWTDPSSTRCWRRSRMMRVGRQSGRST
jgi:hypothetical protein